MKSRAPSIQNNSISELSISSSKESETNEVKEQKIQAYVKKFKEEVEAKFLSSKTNSNYRFPKSAISEIMNNSFDSLEGVMYYDLESQNIKSEIKTNFNEKRLSETTQLVEMISKLGKLDIRYLKSQIKNVKSPLFKMLATGIQKKIQKERQSVESIRSSKANKIKPKEAEVIVLEKKLFENSSCSTIHNTTNLYQKQLKASPSKGGISSATARNNPLQNYLKRKLNNTENLQKFGHKNNISTNHKQNDRNASSEISKQIKFKISSDKNKNNEYTKESIAQIQKPLKTTIPNFQSLLQEFRKKGQNGNIGCSSKCVSNRSVSNSKVLTKINIISSNLNKGSFVKKGNQSGLTKMHLQNLVQKRIFNDRDRDCYRENIAPVRELVYGSNGIYQCLRRDESGMALNSKWEKLKLSKNQVI